MDLEFSAEQEMLREMVRGMLAQHSPLSKVRELEDDPTGYDPALWDQFKALDLVGLLLPEEHGGSGQSMLEGVVLYEELGRALAPTPHFVSAVLTGGALAHAATEDLHRDVLTAIAGGDRIATVAWLEPEGAFRARGVQTRAEGGRLTGVKRHVAYAAAADELLVLARTGDGDEDVELYLVDRADPGVTLTQQFTIASDCQYRVDLDGAEGTLVGDAGTGWSTWQRVMLDGAILQAAAAVGGAAYALDITNQYAKDRHQFDKPLGAFQSIAHYLADAVTRLDGANTLVHEAAWARSVGRPVDGLAPMAKLFADRTYRDITAMAQQIWGGVGFTLEYDIQLFFRRAKAGQLNWWDSKHCEELVAASVLDAPTPV
jgi:alkylation response protein AidB-like acyl-CoA dehydrogenase